ncbi:MAG: Re/Si-specific NAD(P)(+) transhydrogenase subunit alpha [Gemmatimonadetes bacterium]|nr:Re/Si-specific NAD(P)(+) transhydrogenase subunit alpha [Gemmatimonadota bacterium]
MRVAVPKEIVAGERRVALVPETVVQLGKAGLRVSVQAGAGEGAYVPDSAYGDAGAAIVDDAARLLAEADIVVKVQKPVRNERLAQHEVDLLREGSALVSFLQPLNDLELVRLLARRRITSFSMEMVPRTTRAQRMDALSSQATVAGYKAAVLAADSLAKFLPMLTTAAGTIRPGRVLVLGAGVAGLQAIATARRLGALVEAFDVRPAVKEEVQSLGASFIEMPIAEETQTAGGYAKELSAETHRREIDVIREHAREADAIITTAAIPGARAPILIPEDTVKLMRPGAIIVDLAADTGGNCELTRPDQETVCHGVRIVGAANLPATLPVPASQMYSRNIASVLLHLVKDGKLNVDFQDEITSGMCVTHAGEVVHERIKARMAS